MSSIIIHMYTCQHLEVRNQDTFIIALTPHSHSTPCRCRPCKASHQTPLTHWTLKTWEEEDRRSKQINFLISFIKINHAQSAIRTGIYKLVYVQFGSIKEVSFQFAEKKPGKILNIYILNSTSKNRNTYWLKFLKIGTSNFWTF